jgi:hypothetical protein
MKWYWWIPLIGVFFVEKFAEYLYVRDPKENQTKYMILFPLWLLTHVLTLVSFAYVYIV